MDEAASLPATFLSRTDPSASLMEHFSFIVVSGCQAVRRRFGSENSTTTLKDQVCFETEALRH
jgi:hypothetical protein